MVKGRFAPDIRIAADYKNSDQLFNVCCYAFLCNVASAISDGLYEKFKTLRMVRDAVDQPYDNKFPYGDLYRKFILALERELGNRRSLRLAESNHKKPEEFGADGGLQMSKMQGSEEDSDEEVRRVMLESDELDPVVKAVIVNDNLSLERAACMIADIDHPEDYKSYSEFEHAIEKRMADTKETRVNVMSPFSREEGRAAEAITPAFNETGLTGIPCIKHYQYLDRMHNAGIRWPQELRIGTQFIRTSLTDGYVSYIYQRWLQIMTREQLNKDHISHIYFHNMAKDKGVRPGLIDKVNPALHQEYKGTDLLMKLEEEHPNMLLIVLPADKGWMSNSKVNSTKPVHVAKQAKEAIFSVAMGVGDYEHQDFHISRHASSLVFGTDRDKEAIMRALIECSFDRMGVTDDDDVISRAQFQAIYFDFMKYQIPNFIIERLKPDFISYPCKNNIDRGGVTSAYTNLMKSIDTGCPLSEAEFKQAVHASPVLVKGRALNQHIKNLWNAVNNYLHGLEHKNEPIPTGCEYLVKWCKAHSYFARQDLNVSMEHNQGVRQDYIVKRLEDYRERLLASIQGHDEESFFVRKMNVKIGAVNRLYQALNGEDVTFQVKDMDFFLNQDEMKQTLFMNDTLPAIYRDAIQSGGFKPSKHLPLDEAIEMDELDERHKIKRPGSGQGGGFHSNN